MSLTMGRIFFWLLAAFLLTGVSAVHAQPRGKIPRIAYIMGRAGPMAFDEAFGLGLRELGYVDGQNIAIEYRFGDGKEHRLNEFMAEALRLKPDMIVTSGTPAVLAAKQTTTTIPIVMATSSDAVRDGLITSLARPGGNVTGLSIFVPELTGKRLELLKETIPRLSRVATIWNAANAGNGPLVKDTELAARELKLELQLVGVRDTSDFEGAFARMEKHHSGALNILSDAFMVTNRARVTSLAVKSRLPSMFPNDVYVQAGGLLSYGPDLVATFRRTAFFVDRILKGAKPADLPVEQPTKFVLTINLNTAKQIGLTIPPNVLARADKVIR